jgi:nucleoside-diphosphate-sugar epimerase
MRLDVSKLERAGWRPSKSSLEAVKATIASLV